MDANVLKNLFGRLSGQGLAPVEIPRLIEHVFSLICDGGDFTVASVNNDLESLGWRGGVVDATTFELIISFFKKGDNFKLKRQVLH